jgi:hypothetical protein
MTRNDAIKLFGGEARVLSEALGVTTPRVYQFPANEPLPQPVVDRVLGAALRCGCLRYKNGPVVRPVDLLS